MSKLISFLSKVKFLLGLNPHIEKIRDFRDYIPEPYKCVLTIVADFELAWAWRFAKEINTNPNLAISKAKQARLNIPNILDLCEKYSIPITWATVGHLFLENCTNHEDKIHPEIKRLNYFESKYWQYSDGDWFKDDPCSNLKKAPEWYAPDLIDKITKSKVGHEIGCHTFSHIDCSDKICSPDVFESEIKKCIELAKDRNIELKSFIHPAGTVGNLDSLIKFGFTSYRTNKDKVLGYPEFYKNKLLGFPSTADFELRDGWSIKYHIKRYKKIIDRAIKSNTICSLWFHPSLNPEFVNKVLPDIFSHIDKNRDKIYIATTGNYANYLNNKN